MSYAIIKAKSGWSVQIDDIPPATISNIKLWYLKILINAIKTWNNHQYESMPIDLDTMAFIIYMFDQMNQQPQATFIGRKLMAKEMQEDEEFGKSMKQNTTTTTSMELAITSDWKPETMTKFLTTVAMVYKIHNALWLKCVNEVKHFESLGFTITVNSDNLREQLTTVTLANSQLHNIIDDLHKENAKNQIIINEESTINNDLRKKLSNSCKENEAKQAIIDELHRKDVEQKDTIEYLRIGIINYYDQLKDCKERLAKIRGYVE